MADTTVNNADAGDKRLDDYSVVKYVDHFNNSMLITLDDKEVRLVADFDNISRLQAATGRGEMAHIMRFERAEFGITDVATIIYYGMERKDRRFASVSDVGNAILKSKKYSEYIRVAVGFLTLSMSDGSAPDTKKDETVETAGQ